MAQNKLSHAQLDQLIAPVALYPDALLSQIFMGATYPDDIVAAAKWSATHASLSGDQAVKSAGNQPWDPSVQALTAFPSVLDMMGRQPDWVQSMGDAFLAQPDDVMDAVQRLRQQAVQAGNLQSSKQQTVTTSTNNDKTVVVIQPANPQVVYVPSYNPVTVYGTWAYPSYPPYYYPAPAGSAFATSLVSGIGFGLGVAAVDSLWGGFDWRHNDVNINVNRYNRVNVNHQINQTNVHNNQVSWQNTQSVHRNNSNIKENSSRTRTSETHQTTRRTTASSSAQNDARDRAAQSFHDRTGQSAAGHTQTRKNTTQQSTRSAPLRQEIPAQDKQAASVRQRSDATAARNRSLESNSPHALRGAQNNNPTRRQAQRDSPRTSGGEHLGGRR